LCILVVTIFVFIPTEGGNFFIKTLEQVQPDLLLINNLQDSVSSAGMLIAAAQETQTNPPAVSQPQQTIPSAATSEPVSPTSTDKPSESGSPVSTQNPSVAPSSSSETITPKPRKRRIKKRRVPAASQTSPSTPSPAAKQPSSSIMQKPETPTSDQPSSSTAQPSPSGPTKPQAPVSGPSTPSTSSKPQTPAVSQPAPSSAQQSSSPTLEKPGEDAQKVFLSLEEAINLALVNNFDIAIERFNPKINTERVTTAESRFDPVTFADSDTSKTLTPSASQVTGTDEEAQNFNGGVRQTLSPGTSYQIAFNNTRRSTNSPLATINPSYRSNLVLSLTQPLLRGAGSAFNRAPIVIARNNRDISVSSLRNRIIQVLSDVQSIYWDLVFTIGDLDAKKLSLKLAQDLVRINKAQVEVGTLAPIEILQAEASAAAREDAVLVAEENLRDTEDRLKRILNFRRGDQQFWDAIVMPLDKPTFDVKDISVEDSIKIALQSRPELAQARLNLENRNVDVSTTKNGLLPVVNFQGAVGLNGLGADYGEDLNELSSGDFYSWQAGVNFEFPLGNRSAKSTHSAAKLAAEQAEVSIKNTEQQVILDVRLAVRQVRTAVKRVEATRIARELAERQLDAEQKKFNEGLSTNFNVLQFQDDLATAVSNEVRAITDYNKALVALERALGTTLESRNVKVQ
jgi:outer membrane protein TolC